MGCTWASTVQRVQTPATREVRVVKDMRAEIDHITAQQLRPELTPLRLRSEKISCSSLDLSRRQSQPKRMILSRVKGKTSIQNSAGTMYEM